MTAAREMYGRAAWTIAFALVIYYINHQEYPGPSLRLTLVILAIGLGFAAAGYGMAWLAGPGRQRVLDLAVDSLQLKGDERILDAGSPGGQLGLAAARRLKTGKVVALGSSGEFDAAREASKNEGLGDRIRFESGDPKVLSYPSKSFDSAICSQALARLASAAERETAVKELMRVVKPGGRIVVHEIGDPPATLQIMTRCGLADPAVSQSNLPLGLGGRVFLATNPS